MKVGGFMQVKYLKISVGTVLGLLFLVGCSPGGDSLFTDRKADSTSMTIDTEPYQTELSLQSSKTSFVSSTNSRTDYVEVSGSCYTSTYPNHYIAAYNASNALIASYDTLNTSSANNQAKCVNGRFSMAVSIASFGSKTSNQVILRLIAYESATSTQNPITNDTNGAQTVSVIKAY